MERVKDFAVLDLLVLSMAAVFALIGAGDNCGGDALNSRLATVYSLTHYGTWTIDRPATEPPIPFEQGTIDKVEIDGHLISSKPPMLPLMMTGVYLALHATVGWDLDHERDVPKIVRVMSFVLVGIPYLLALVFFAKILAHFVSDPLTRLVLLFSLAFCTQLWGYSTHINNHVPAAGLMVIALYFALGMGAGKLAPRTWRFLVFGFAGGLVPAIDLPATIFVVFAGLYLLYKFPAKTLVWVAIGAAIPVTVHMAAMLASTGSVLPVQTRNAVYLYEGSYWRSPLGVDALNEPKGAYLFHMLLGRTGLFSLYPILLAGAAATLRAMIKPRMPRRGMVLSGALAFAILTAYYLLKTNNYGGEAYGFRWYIVAMPVLLLMGAPVLASLRARWKWYFVAFMIGVSFYSGYECAKSPWGANREWTCRLFLGPSHGPLDEAKNGD